MHERVMRLIRRLPLSFRVLFRQSLLRVIDLEALSIEADIPRFLGQFMALLLFVGFIHAFGSFFLMMGKPPSMLQIEVMTWQVEQQFMAHMMLVIGLSCVLIWDATFPDRRDAMVLTPLPVRTQTVLMAKMAASCAVLGLAIVSLNLFPVFAWPFMLGGPSWLILLTPSIWFALLAISVFVFASILTVQGVTALLLPRRICLQLSSWLQLAAFGYFLASFFLVPSLDTADALAAPVHHTLVAWVAHLLVLCDDAAIEWHAGAAVRMAGVAGLVHAHRSSCGRVGIVAAVLSAHSAQDRGSARLAAGASRVALAAAIGKHACGDHIAL